MQRKLFACAFALAWALPAHAADDAEIAGIREEIRQLRQSYEARIQALESRLAQAEKRADAAPEAPAQPPAAASAFNPGISLILSGTWANLSQDPADHAITGFAPTGGEVGPGERGFSLGESELVAGANIDPWLRGFFTAALTPENEVEVEEAWFQTLGLGEGLSLKAGRFLSGIGYLNEQHPHTWDFVDAPLAYKAFLGGNLGDDGVQLKWLAPTELFLELGAEATRGRGFPASDDGGNGVGLWTAYAHLGGDLGVSHSWRAGLSYVDASPQARDISGADATGTEVFSSFDGSSRLWVADFVWKWAPQGNPTERNFKLQGEYFRRRESGTLTYDADGSAAGTLAGPAALAYGSRQWGLYVQGVYQFMPRWRVGYRYDRLAHGSVDIGTDASGALSAADFSLLAADHDPDRHSLMLDYSPSEFSRFRVQLARDRSRIDADDDQVFVQYIHSLGAHGAHKY